MRNLRISHQPKNGRIPSAPATQRLMHLEEPFSGQFLRFDLQSGRSAFLPISAIPLLPTSGHKTHNSMPCCDADGGGECGR
jgi:hypothetical protein